MAHIGFDYGISEASTCRYVKEVEEILIKSGQFSLPGKKKLQGDNIEIVVIDATEMPIQRPKKNKGKITRENKKDIL